MTQRHPIKTASRSGAIRYDVVWTLPFSEFLRTGYVETQTWWLDSIHTGEIAAKKRFKAIADVVKDNNGCVLLFEVITNPKDSAFNQRVIDRSGHPYRPPGINDINPVTIDVTDAFKRISARWHAKNRRTIEDDHMQPKIRRRPKRNHGASITIGVLLTIMALAASASFIYLQGDASASSTSRQRDASVTMVRPQERIIVPVRTSESLCDVYTLSGSTRGMHYLGRERCPSQK